MGLASSARSWEAVCGSAWCGIRDRKSPACEADEVRREWRPEDWAEEPGRGRDGDGGAKCWFDVFFPPGLDGVDTDVGCTGWGLGRGGGSMSSSGMVKHPKQNVVCFLGFGRAILVGPLGRPGPFCGFSDWVRMSPSRSASVSMLVRPSRMGVCDILGPGLDFVEALAWSLCCQQYRVSSAGSSVRMVEGFRREVVGASSSAAIERLHGRPLEVTPRHVDDGSLESERPSRDSGVLA
jgi:hypothetical protein